MSSLRVQKEKEDASSSSGKSFTALSGTARTAMGQVGAQMASKRASVVQKISTTLGLRKEPESYPSAGAGLAL